MALIDRYLQAVKFWLPRDKKDDIIAELAEDLRSQIEEKESDLGHPLSDDEVEPILKRCGAPIAVAERYLPQRSLIGPALFPIYSVVIRALFLYFLFPWLLLWIVISIISPDFRADHPGLALIASLEPWWIACTHALFFNTLAFALLDRSQMRSQLVNTWNPRSLPPVQSRNHIPRSSTVFELTTSVLALVLWLQMGFSHRVFHVFGLDIVLSQSWPYFFWALTTISAASIFLSCMNVGNPRWTHAKACLRLGLDCTSWMLMYWLFRSNLLQSLSGNDLSPNRALNFVSSINFWTARSATWVLLIGIVVLIFDVRRIIRMATNATRATA
jgi:hypothetical protein